MRGAGAVVLADRVDRLRIAEAAHEVRERRRIEEAQALLGLGELLLDEPVGIGAHHLLGQVVGLDVEEPVPGERRPGLGDVGVEIVLRNDVDDRRARDLLRMVEAHAVQHARAAVVAGGVEALEAERRHHLDLVLRHRAERIVDVLRTARRLLGIAVAAQVGRHHRELGREPRRDLLPRQMIERIAVHQQQRRALAAGHGDDAGAGCLDLAALEAVEHGHSRIACPHASAVLFNAADDIAIATSQGRLPRQARPRSSPPSRSAHRTPRAS